MLRYTRCNIVILIAATTRLMLPSKSLCYIGYTSTWWQHDCWLTVQTLYAIYILTPKRISQRNVQKGKWAYFLVAPTLYVYIYLHTYIHIYIYVYIHTYISTSSCWRLGRMWANQGRWGWPLDVRVQALQIVLNWMMNMVRQCEQSVLPCFLVSV